MIGGANYIPDATFGLKALIDTHLNPHLSFFIALPTATIVLLV